MFFNLLTRFISFKNKYALLYTFVGTQLRNVAAQDVRKTGHFQENDAMNPNFNVLNRIAVI